MKRVARPFPYLAIASLLIGVGSAGAQVVLTGPGWQPLWKWAMLGGFGCAAVISLIGAIQYFFFPVGDDQATASSPVTAHGGHSVAIGPHSNVGPVNTGPGIAAHNVTINAPPAAPPRLTFNWNMQEACRYRLDQLGREPTADDVYNIFRDFRQAARDGDLVVRGIPLTGPSPIFGIDAPHENIPRGHWREMDFEVTAYLTGDARNVREAHTEPTDGPTSRTPAPYYGLMVSQAQVETLWPRPL